MNTFSAFNGALSKKASLIVVNQEAFWHLIAKEIWISLHS